MSYSHDRFENRTPRHQRKKELTVLIFISLIIISTIFVYTYFLFFPIITSKYPKINIRYENELSATGYNNCTFELNSNDESEKIFLLDGKIKIRGSGDKQGVNRWPKKGYRIELSEEESLLGMRKDDDWLLLAMYLDYPRMRIKMCFDVWGRLEPTNPTAIAPESEYVTLFLNGEFEGLYLLVEKNDRRLYGLEDVQNNINSSFIFQVKGHTILDTYLPAAWEQDWPNEDEGIYIMEEILTPLFSFINDSSDAEFFNCKNGIFSKFDKLNLIDFFVFNYFIYHEDFWIKNYFIIRNSYPNKLFLVPWDYDHSFGGFRGNEYEADDNNELYIREHNRLYDRLIGNNDFIKNCSDRWFQLRNDLWTDEFFSDTLTENYEEIDDILEIETDMWNPVVFNENWHNDSDKSVEKLYQWITDRLKFCDIYFDSKYSL